MASCGVMNFPRCELGARLAASRSDIAVFAIYGHPPEQHGPSPYESDGPRKLLFFAIVVDALAVRFVLEL